LFVRGRERRERRVALERLRGDGGLGGHLFFVAAALRAARVGQLGPKLGFASREMRFLASKL